MKSYTDKIEYLQMIVKQLDELETLCNKDEDIEEELCMHLHCAKYQVNQVAHELHKKQQHVDLIKKDYDICIPLESLVIGGRN